MNNPSLRFNIALFAFIPPIQMGIDIYTPSMPHMVTALSTSTAAIEWSMIIYLIAMGLSEFIAGVVSDYCGRRWTLLVSAVFFLVGSVLCMFAHTITALLVGRFIQGAGSGIQVVMTAIVSDCYQGKRLSKVTSYMSMGWSLMPILAPGIGGFLQQAFGWQANFVVMAIYIVVAAVLAYMWIPETFAREKRPRVSPWVYSHGLWRLTQNRVFIIATLLMILMWSVMMLFNVMTPFLFETQLGLSAAQYGMIALIYGAAYFVGSLINIRLQKRLRSRRLIFIGLWITLASSIALAITGLFHLLSLAWIMPFLLVAVAATGLVFPHCLAKAMQQFNPAQAGLGSAWMSALIILGTALITIFTANIHIHSQMPLALAYVAIAGVSLPLAWKI